MEEQPQPAMDPVSNLLSEFGTRLNEVEEKQRLLKDRILLIGENLVSTKKEVKDEEIDVKNQIADIELEIKSLKQLTNRVINELGSLARKSEVHILERQMKMFPHHSH